MLDLSDLLAPPKSTKVCQVASALDAIDPDAAAQLRPVIASLRVNYVAGRVGVIPRDNVVAAFDRCCAHVSRDSLSQHVRSRCSCA